MAERLVSLLATQVARIRFPVLARPMFRVEKVDLFCNSGQGSQGPSRLKVRIEVFRTISFVTCVHYFFLVFSRVRRNLEHLENRS
jgi:hypothetical protein